MHSGWVLALAIAGELRQVHCVWNGPLPDTSAGTARNDKDAEPAAEDTLFTYPDGGETIDLKHLQPDHPLYREAEKTPPPEAGTRLPGFPPLPENAMKQFPGLRTHHHDYHSAKGETDVCKRVCEHPLAMPCGNRCVHSRREPRCTEIHGKACWPNDKCKVVCMKGKPCGDECIDTDKECHEIHGGACPPFGNPWPYKVSQFWDVLDPPKGWHSYEAYAAANLPRKRRRLKRKDEKRKDEV